MLGKRWSSLITLESRPGAAVTPYALKKVSPFYFDPVRGEVATLKEEAYERGFAKGMAAGREQGKKSAEADRLGFFVNLAKELAHIFEETVKQAEQDIIKAAVAMSKRIIGDVASPSPEQLLLHVQEIVRKLAPTETVYIRLHPDDYHHLMQENKKILQAIEGVKWIKFERMESLSPGECIVETPHKIVDGRIQSQLSAIEKQLIARSVAP